MRQYKRITVKPISGAMGAEIFNVDLSTDLDSETWEEIKDAWSTYLVLLFRDQDLTDKQQFNFTH